MKLLIRADASTNIGSGHVMRCLALSEAWQATGGRAVFMSHCQSDMLIQRMNLAGTDYIALGEPHPAPADLGQTLDCLEEQHADWLVLDGYHFDPAYQQAVRAAGYRLLVIDDMAHWPIYYADILLNQNLGAEKLKYNCGQDTTLLLGSRNVLLRQEFLSWRGWQREVPIMARKVLVTMGGGDPDNVTLKIIHALERVQVDGLETVVVVGNSNPHREALQMELRKVRSKIRLEYNGPNMPELMAWADVAITGGGSTCWELLFMGLPSLVLVLAENQRTIADNLDEAGLSINLGWHEDVGASRIAHVASRLVSSQELRRNMAWRGQAMIDGLGKNRVVREMSSQGLLLRRVANSDCELLWKWANDPDVRESAFSSRQIPLGDHNTWFRKKSEDPGCVQYIGLDENNVPVGQVRFDVRNCEAEVDVSVAQNHRGRGYGVALIRRGVRALREEATVNVIHALVKLENRLSQQAFQSAGFVAQGVEEVKGQRTMHLIWRRDE